MNAITKDDIAELEANIKNLRRENEALRKTLLDEFAMCALNGVMAKETHPDFANDDFQEIECAMRYWYQNIAIHSYNMAEAMLEERSVLIEARK